MFERRLRLVLVLPVACMGVVAARLYQLQILRGEEYARKADAALVSPRQYLPPLRGRILDRMGRELVSDEPAQDVAVHYGALSMDERFLMLYGDRIRRNEPAWRKAPQAEVVGEARRRIARMWLTLERVSGVPLAELRRKRDAICRSVEGLRRAIWAARREKGFDEPLEKLRLREEEGFHALLHDIAPEARTRVEMELDRLPFVRIEPSVRRVWQDHTRSLCHVLGELGQVSPEMIRDDPRRDDPLACRRADDEVGVSGVERVSEAMLRGKRGMEERYLDGSVRTHIPPIDGLDVQLTVDVALQDQIARVLEETVAQHPSSTGAACVVLDVVTREVLALVSVPTYDRRTLRENFARLRDDSRRLPLRFRAVQEEYQPGSILKPVALLAGFAHDLVSPGQRVACSGALVPGASSWHCWTHWRGLPGHGELNAEEAIQHSCNIYFYTLGQRVGAHRLTRFYADFIRGPAGGPAAGRGRSTTGLVEESGGLVPTREWLQSRRGREFTVADARNYAIGQGEIQLTPLQAANLFATLATGAFRDPTLIANDGRSRPASHFPQVPAAAWDLVRRGLDRCVNEEGGTAYKYARLEDLRICGKTGSAECVPRVTERRYTFAAPPGEKHERSVVAPSLEAARQRLGLGSSAMPLRREVAARWPAVDPATGRVPTHSWFAGFAPADQPRVAVALVIEYGGSGGAVAGPAARAVFEVILRSPGEYLPRAGNALTSAVR